MAEPVTTATAAAAATKAKAALAKLGALAKREALLEGLHSGADGSLGRKLVMLSMAPVAILFALLLLVMLPVMVVVLGVGGIGSPAFAAAPPGCPSPPALEEATGIPATYVPIYCAAADRYEVNLYLLASIHEQETGFSTDPTTPSGTNPFGCCAGPMQFNLAVTWQAHRDAFRAVLAARAGERSADAAALEGARDSFRPYPLDRAELPSCEGVPPKVGCVYDDLDAISAAAHKLSADGADGDLYSDAARDAVLDYNDDAAYADAVLIQAREWELLGATAGASTSGGAKGIVDQAALVASEFGAHVCSDYRPGSTTASGNVSDHAFNDANRAARDICFRDVDPHTGPPPPQLDQAAVAIGDMFGRRYEYGATIDADIFDWKGHRIEVIWRTPLYGGHMGHIHVGACRGC